MISNPCTFFVNGSDEESFTYEGGNTLFHFSPHDNNLSTHMDTNIIFFAHNKEHALDVLKRMFEFAMNCSLKKIEYQTKKKYKDYHDEEFLERTEYFNRKYIKYLTAIEEGKVKLSSVPTNQVYKVGWASNDTI